jgi:phospholipid/cholesterol/gamma-HCH transport system substrate-binding protein
MTASSRNRMLSRLTSSSPKTKGAMVLAVLFVFSLFAFNHPRVMTTLSSGQHLKAEFTSEYKLSPYQSVVKVAGVKVGVVTGFNRTAENHSVVSMKLDPRTRAKLGSSPSANVRPTLLLGGTYYVELVPGGRTTAVADGATIPVARTTVPVELDKVLSTVTPDASVAVKGTVKSLDATFDKDGRKQVQRFLANSPKTLAPATQVLKALRGTNPDVDLTRLVSSTQNLAAAMTRNEGELGSIIDGLQGTSGALAASRSALAATVAHGPETLRATRTGLADLDGTLDQLRVTANSFAPSARALDHVLGELGPVLKTARPVIADARVVARDARPVVQNLVPTTRLATRVLDDVKGPVLNRLGGPITDAVMSPWHGTGKYDGGGNDHKLYEETGYLLANTADVFKFHDKNGAMGRLMAGVGLSTPGGIIGHSIEEYLEMLGYQLPAGPQDGATTGGSNALSLPDTSAPSATGSGPLEQLLQLPLVLGGAR